MCCHGCGQVMVDIKPPKRFPEEKVPALRGLKLCRGCGVNGNGHLLVAGNAAAGVQGTVPLKDEEGELVRDLLLCVAAEGGNMLHACRVRNRDKNASRNIWEALNAMIRGEERPEYLRPRPRTRRPPRIRNGPIVAS